MSDLEFSQTLELMVRISRIAGGEHFFLSASELVYRTDRDLVLAPLLCVRSARFQKSTELLVRARPSLVMTEPTSLRSRSYRSNASFARLPATCVPAKGFAFKPLLWVPCKKPPNTISSAYVRVCL